MRLKQICRSILIGAVVLLPLKVGAQIIFPPPIIYPFPYDDLIVLNPIEPFSYRFTTIDPLLFANTGFNLKSLDLEPISLDIVSGFDPDLGIDLLQHSIQDRFVLIDGTLGLSLGTPDPSGARQNVRINYQMDVRRDSLRARQIGRQISARRNSGYEQWLRANWLQDIPRRDARMIDARLMRLDEETGRWGRAVDAIRARRNADIRWMGDSEPDGILGHHGYNNENGFVWAVLDTNSQYAVGINFDHDDDGILNAEDNCPMVANTDQGNADGADDGGDACDEDDDNDTVADDVDNCPLVANEDQVDYDGNGVGYACETDDDGDGVFGGLDLCPSTAGGDVNPDGCSVADLCPCDNGWKNHGKYVQCTTQTADAFLKTGVISDTNKGSIVSVAAESACGFRDP